MSLLFYTIITLLMYFSVLYKEINIDTDILVLKKKNLISALYSFVTSDKDTDLIPTPVARKSALQ